MGRRWRANSVEYVLKHIEVLTKKYNVEHIHFEDDNITLDKERFEGILDGIIERKLNFSWDTPNGIRADTLEDRIVAKMKKTHCSSLMIGVESGDKFVLEKIIDKKLDLCDVINTAKLCKKYNIPLSASFVIGFPGEKRQNIFNTINFALMLKKKYDVNGEFLIAAPLYKTRLYDICKKNKFLTKKLTPEALSRCEEGRGIIKTKDFTSEEVSMLRIYATKKMAEAKLVNYFKHPLQTIHFISKNPERVLRFIKRF
jgi:magnesium-protoporphyrin IX monomethyl ester (oxidative) cyclase